MKNVFFAAIAALTLAVPAFAGSIDNVQDLQEIRGHPDINILRVASPVSERETVTINGQVFEILVNGTSIVTSTANVPVSLVSTGTTAAQAIAALVPAINGVAGFTATTITGGILITANRTGAQGGGLHGDHGGRKQRPSVLDDSTGATGSEAPYPPVTLARQARRDRGLHSGPQDFRWSPSNPVSGIVQVKPGPQATARPSMVSLLITGSLEPGRGSRTRGRRATSPATPSTLLHLSD